MIPRSACYPVFIHEDVAEVKGDTNPREITKALGARWSLLDEKEKTKYHEQAEKENEAALDAMNNAMKMDTTAATPAANATANRKCSKCGNCDAMPRDCVIFTGMQVADVEHDYDGRRCIDCTNLMYNRLGLDVLVAHAHKDPCPDADGSASKTTQTDIPMATIPQQRTVQNTTTRKSNA